METEKIQAMTWVKPINTAKEMEIEGNTRFRVNSDKFIMSPLQQSADLHIVSIHEGVENDRVLETINAGEYTQIQGLVRNVELYLETSETFYVKF